MPKILDTNNISKLRNKYKTKILGLAHGSFDIFHYGHLLHLKKAKSLCDILVVSITNDKFINKAPGRPVFNLKQRLEIIASINFVDFVVVSNEKTSTKIIRSIKPNIYFKGNDYKKEKKDHTGGITLEKKEVRKFGGKIIITNEETFSSSNLINRYSNELEDGTKKYLLNLRKKN